MSATLIIDEKLLAVAEKLANDTDRTVAQVVEDALREMMVRGNGCVKFKTTLQIDELHTNSYSKLNPAIDFSNNARLRELMDEEDGYSGR